MRSIGDLASLMMSSRRQSTLRQNAEASAQSATTGLANDKARHLGGNSTSLALLERKIELLKQYQDNTVEARTMASAVQSSLEKISGGTEEFFNSLALSSQIDTQAELQILSNQASALFEDSINTLNISVAGKFIFSGTAVSTQPLPNGDDVWEQLKSDLAGVTNANTASQVIDNWFDNPVGPYHVDIYKGSMADNVGFPIDAESKIQLSARANTPELLNILKALAKSAFAADKDNQLSAVDQKDLFSRSRISLMQSNTQLTSAQASIGATEAMIESIFGNPENYGTSEQSTVAAVKPWRIPQSAIHSP